MVYIIPVADIEVKARKWGDSIAVILPKEVVRQENIKINDKIHLIVEKQCDISDLFGICKTKKTAQQLKNESRSGWE